MAGRVIVVTSEGRGEDHDRGEYRDRIGLAP